MITHALTLLAAVAAPCEPAQDSPTVVQDSPAARVPPRAPKRFEVASLELEQVTLSEACAALQEASGVPILARGEAPVKIDLQLTRVGLWDAVLALCDAAHVGLAPVGTDGDAIVLGHAWERPFAVADGPVLVVARADGVRRERSGTLDLELRLVPGLVVVGAAPPGLVQGRDYEG